MHKPVLQVLKMWGSRAVTYRPGGLGMTHVADEYLSIEELEKWVKST